LTQNQIGIKFRSMFSRPCPKQCKQAPATSYPLVFCACKAALNSDKNTCSIWVF